MYWSLACFLSRDNASKRISAWRCFQIAVVWWKQSLSFLCLRACLISKTLLLLQTAFIHIKKPEKWEIGFTQGEKWNITEHSQRAWAAPQQRANGEILPKVGVLESSPGSFTQLHWAHLETKHGTPSRGFPLPVSHAYAHVQNVCCEVSGPGAFATVGCGSRSCPAGLCFSRSESRHRKPPRPWGSCSPSGGVNWHLGLCWAAKSHRLLLNLICWFWAGGGSWGSPSAAPPGSSLLAALIRNHSFFSAEGLSLPVVLNCFPLRTDYPRSKRNVEEVAGSTKY